jgi:peptidoglycan hydrolase FlgJ
MKVPAPAPTVPVHETSSLAPRAAGGDAAHTAHSARIADAAVRFEGYFIGELLKSMHRSTAVLADPDSARNDQTNAGMRSLADQALADTLARQRAFGIADAMIRQLLPATPSTRMEDNP